MKREISCTVAPEVAYDEVQLNAFLRNKLKISSEQVYIRLTNRSIDARSRQVKVNIKAEIFEGEQPSSPISYRTDYPDVSHADSVVIVGAGPGGMFAALRLIELGIRPIVVERGKDVQARRRDLAAINKSQIVNPDSNYCFGEGGAGTYSDGKLYTRSKKRGDFRRILEIFAAHGANPDILVEAHPHIGTNKLPKIVAAIRQSILDAGGQMLFDTRVEDFVLEDNRIKGVVTQNGDVIDGQAVILATGHSARDIFYLLKKKKILLASKPYALGVRVEHRQDLIDKIQYHQPERGPFLPAAAYSLVSQVKYQGLQKGVFSFCMCPGGFIVPAATSPGEIVVNGMSPSRRNSKYANSGIVVAIDETDLKEYAEHGIFAGLAYQQSVEQSAFRATAGGQTAPAQLLGDFVAAKHSSSLLETSYQPGLQSVEMDAVLPKPVAQRLRLAFKEFDKKMRGYLTNEAQIVGVESRTSSPVRIPRDSQTLEHPQVKGLFPCGEGAGYAGGIASAAMDGERCAEMVARLYFGERVAVSLQK